MDLSQDCVVVFLFVITLMCCLFFLFKLITFLINIVLHIKNKNKYKNVIPSYMQQCAEVEQSLQKKGSEDETR